MRMKQVKTSLPIDPTAGYGSHLTKGFSMKIFHEVTALASAYSAHPDCEYIS